MVRTTISQCDVEASEMTLADMAFIKKLFSMDLKITLGNSKLTLMRSRTLKLKFLLEAN